MSARPDITIVIPAYNEEKRLPRTLSAVLAHMDATGANAELILVDDGSSDGTRRIIEEAAARDGRVAALSNPANLGKGAAVREGVRRARGRVVVFFDADLPYPLATIGQAVERLSRGADLVIGARDLASRDSRWRYSPLRRAATSLFNLLVEWSIPLGIPDTQCGFKAFSDEAAAALFDSLTVRSFAFDIELLLLARRWGMRIERIPVEMARAQGSTIRLTQDSLAMLRDLRAIRRRAKAGAFPPRPLQAPKKTCPV